MNRYDIYYHVSYGINGRYVLLPLGPRYFSTQHKLPHIFPLDCLVSGLHDQLPCGEILEVDMWPNQAGETCHVLTDISILHRFKMH
jgi:hypothetical protein